MDKKKVRPKGCSYRKGKKTSLGKGMDSVLRAVCHGMSWRIGEGIAKGKTELWQD